MSHNNIQIKGIFDVELGSYFQLTKDFSKQSMLSYNTSKTMPDDFKPFSSCVVNVDPINNKVFQIYSFLSFPKIDVSDSLTALGVQFDKLKSYLLLKYGSDTVRLSNNKQFIISIDNKEIMLSLERNSLLIECTDQILLHNCYASFIYY